MVSAMILAVRNRALAENAPAAPAQRAYRHSEIFAETHWRSAQNFRESRDSFETSTRWHVVILPGDGEQRSYFLCGSLAEVTARAKLFFPNPLSILCTPAVAGGSEYIDRRVHSSVRTIGV
jgi:hypothetical protein